MRRPESEATKRLRRERQRERMYAIKWLTHAPHRNGNGITILDEPLNLTGLEQLAQWMQHQERLRGQR